MINTPLIFLDVDGVLNTHDYDYWAGSNKIHHDKVKLVNLIMSQNNAKIVLSSAWRYLVYRGEMNLAGLNWLFRSHGLQKDSIVGVTSEDIVQKFDQFGNPLFAEGLRAGQVVKYREDNNHTGPFIVIDDLDLEFTANGLPFVKTDTNVGLTVPLARLASQLLRDQR